MISNKRNIRTLLILKYFVVSIFILSVSIVNSSPTLHRAARDVHKSLEPFSNFSSLEVFRNGGSEEFTLISPLATGNSSGTTKRRRVIRRRKKVTTPVTSTLPTPTTVVTSVPINHSNVSTFKAYSKTRFHDKIRNVWKIPNLTQEILSSEDEPKQSILEKRESAEFSLNLTKSFEEATQDLNTEESTNPFINSSTPISNELQNSLQFTLQMLHHPFLSSDSGLSEQSHKIPENKNVGLTHSLSGSFAQTPIAHDLGFLPTHLRKQHPLLNPDSIFSSEDGASKTGPRTHIHPTRNHSTFHINELEPNNNKPTTTVVPTTSTVKEESSSTMKPSIGTVPSVTTTATSTIPPILETLTTTNSVPIRTVTVTPEKYTTSATTPFKPTTTLPSVKIPETKPDVAGVLNITEVMSSTETASGTDYKIPIKVPEISDLDNFHVLDESSAHPPVIMFPLDEEKPSSTTSIKYDTTTPSTSVSPSSFESSSAEQLLINQLLGLGGPSTVPTSDSNELGQLFNLLQGQQKRTPIPQQGQDAQSGDPELQNLLQTILQQQLASPNSLNNNQPFDFGALLNLGGNVAPKITTVAPVPTAPPPPPPPSQNEGLSDSDLKSIFALLDAQTSTTKPTTTTTRTTTTTTTTTPRPTTTVPIALPPQLTTTLHPALQSMLDLFQNQLKPFQSLPSVPTPQFPKNLNAIIPQVKPVVVETTTHVPIKSAPVPTSTPNSLDILSQLLNFGSLAGNSKINPVRATPAPEFSLASIFGNNNQNVFPSNFPSPVPAAPPVAQATAPSESNQLLNFFGGQPSYHATTPPSPSGLYYWLDMNAFLGGDPKADPMSGIRPKMGSRYPFLKVK